MWEKKGTLYTMTNNMNVFEEVKNRTTHLIQQLHFWIYITPTPSEIIVIKIYLYSCVHSIIHNNPGIETTCLFMNEWIKKVLYIYTIVC